MLKPGQVFLSFTMPPKLGIPSYLNYLYPGLEPGELLAKNVFSKSEYFVDDMICDHPRFQTLTKNTRLRRGELHQMTAAIFKDIYTDMDSILHEKNTREKSTWMPSGLACALFKPLSECLVHLKQDGFLICSTYLLHFCSLCQLRRLSIKANS